MLSEPPDRRRRTARTAGGAAESTVIHALPVGGGILALSPAPGTGGDYRGDLDHIAGWTPALVISLTTNLELLETGAKDFGAHVQDKGTRWVHLPVRDGDGPNANMRALWPEVSVQARRALAGGGRVLVHCRAGCGRSGMVALRLMIESGEAADDALKRLRAVRPCAIETEPQMRWALQAKRPTAQFVRRGPIS